MTHNKTNIPILKKNKNTHSLVSESQIHNKHELKGPGPQNPKRKNREKGKGRQKGKEKRILSAIPIFDSEQIQARGWEWEAETWDRNEKPRLSRVRDRAARDSEIEKPRDERHKAAERERERKKECGLDVFRSGISLLAETVGFLRYGRYSFSKAGIFSGTKQRGYSYQSTGRYSIYWSYQLVRYDIIFTV